MKALKLTAHVKAVDPDDPIGSFEAVLSTPTVDRDGEVVDSKAFEPLPESIPVHMDHQIFDVLKVVGRGVPFYDDDDLKIRGVFASTDEAQKVRALVSDGSVQTMSVGFMDTKTSDVDGTTHITSAELIEASFVSVPSNRDALVSLAKAYDPVQVDTTHLAQHLHDFAAANGASCAHKTPDPDPDVPPPPAAAHPAEVVVARAQALAAEAELLLID